jgi:hypothetical protein
MGMGETNIPDRSKIFSVMGFIKKFDRKESVTNGLAKKKECWVPTTRFW